MPWGQAEAEIPHEQHAVAVMGRQSLRALPRLLSLSCTPSTGCSLDLVLTGCGAHWMCCLLDGMLSRWDGPGMRWCLDGLMAGMLLRRKT